MNKKKKITLTIVSISAAILLIAAFFIFADSSPNKAIIKTSKGDITIELYPNEAPITVNNFKEYIKEDFYSNTVFHRVIENFMIQGGGFAPDGKQKQTNPPIKLESNNGLSNHKYTIAMARTNNPDSATSQFFINTADNTFLDYTQTNPGYTVFGKVINGFEVVDKIESTQTTTKYTYHENWPIEDIIIYSVELI